MIKSWRFEGAPDDWSRLYAWSTSRLEVRTFAEAGQELLSTTLSDKEAEQLAGFRKLYRAMRFEPGLTSYIHPPTGASTLPPVHSLTLHPQPIRFSSRKAVSPIMAVFRKEVNEYIRAAETLLSPASMDKPLTKEECKIVEFYTSSLSDGFYPVSTNS